MTRVPEVCWVVWVAEEVGEVAGVVAPVHTVVDPNSVQVQLYQDQDQDRKHVIKELFFVTIE